VAADRAASAGVGVNRIGAELAAFVDPVMAAVAAVAAVAGGAIRAAGCPARAATP
jgi:hypothetical protein